MSRREQILLSGLYTGAVVALAFGISEAWAGHPGATNDLLISIAFSLLALHAPGGKP